MNLSRGMLLITVLIALCLFVTSPMAGAAAPASCCNCVASGIAPGGETIWQCPCGSSVGGEGCAIRPNSCEVTGNCPG